MIDFDEYCNQQGPEDKEQSFDTEQARTTPVPTTACNSQVGVTVQGNNTHQFPTNEVREYKFGISITMYPNGRVFHKMWEMGWKAKQNNLKKVHKKPLDEPIKAEEEVH